MPCSVKKPLALARYTGAWYGIARQLKTGLLAPTTYTKEALLGYGDDPRKVILSVDMMLQDKCRCGTTGDLSAWVCYILSRSTAQAVNGGTATNPCPGTAPRLVPHPPPVPLRPVAIMRREDCTVYGVFESPACQTMHVVSAKLVADRGIVRRRTLGPEPDRQEVLRALTCMGEPLISACALLAGV